MKITNKIISGFLALVMMISIPIHSYATVTVYSQTDSRWGSHPYGYRDSGCTKPATISTSGCGILALTNAVYYMNGSFIPPASLADYAVNNGYRVNGTGTAFSLYPAYSYAAGSTYGFSCSSSDLNTSLSSLKTHLQQGNAVIAPSQTLATGSGHIMAIVDYDSSSDRYLVLDSYVSSNRFSSSSSWQTINSSLKTGNGKVKFSGFIYLYNKTPTSNPNPPAPPAASTLSLSGASIPSSITQGNGFSVKGTVSSNYNLEWVQAAIFSSSGTVLQEAHASPNTKSYSLSNFDSSLRFGQLGTGTYGYHIEATDVSGNFKVLNSSSFTVKGKNGDTSATSSLSLTNYTAPSSLTKGSGFTIKGTVNSTYNLEYVCAFISDSSGNIKFSASADPGTTTYNIANFDSQLKFGQLAVGSYTYNVEATDYQHHYEMLLSQSFTVSEGEWTVNIPKFPDYLPQGYDYDFSGTLSSPRPFEYVGLELKNSSDQIVQSYSCDPGTYTYDIANANSAFHFENLAPGSYYLQVEATNYDHDFRVLSWGGFTIVAPTKVTFDANGGTNAPSAQNKAYGRDLTLSSQKPTKTYMVTYELNGGSAGSNATTQTANCTFNNWVDKNTGTQYNSGAVYRANEATTMVAQWTNPMITPFTPTRSGYTFVGWLDYDYGQEGIISSYQLKGNTTLTAIWKENSFTVHFNGNGATSGSMSDQEIPYNTATALKANAFKRAYTVTYNYYGATGGNSVSSATATSTFNGWATSASGAKVYNDKASVKDLTECGNTFNLYASWTRGTVTLPTPTKTSCTFLGWCKSNAANTVDYAGGATITPSTNLTLYAVWSRSVDAPYWGDMNGDHILTQDDREILLRIREDELVPNAEQKCFGDLNLDGKINGQDSLLIQLLISGDSTNSEINNNANFVWTPPTKTVYNKGDSFNKSGISVTVSNKNNSNVSYTMSDNITVSGYNASTVGKQTLIAKFRDMNFSFEITVKDTEWKVKYNGNGATSGSMSDQVFKCGIAQNLTANAFKRAYTVTYSYSGATSGNSATSATATSTFNGWATSASGSVAYANKASVKDLASAGGTCNLYVNWTLGTVTIPTPTKTGYSFQGWNTKANGSGTMYTAGTTYTPTADITLYAQWKDTTKPTGSIEATNAVAASQTATLSMSDNDSLAGYYWGTSSTYTSNTYTAISDTPTSKTVTKEITAAGTYYLTVKDTAGNVLNNVGKVFYKTTLNANGGTVSPTSVITMTGNSFALPAPTLSGYSCAGWNTKADGSGTSYAVGASYKPTSSITLYAQWKDSEKPTGTITSTNDLADKQTVTLTLNDNAGVSGYYWGTNSNYTANTYTAVEGTPKTKVVSFELNVSGTYCLVVKDITGNVSDVLSKTFRRTTFSTNGGTVSPVSVFSMVSTSFKLPTATKTGYTFDCWTQNADGTGTTYAAGTSFAPPSGSLTLYAQYSPNLYSVKFNGNGATSGSMSDQTFTYDVAQNLTANAFKRAYTVTYNYNGATGGNSASTATATATFNGWNTKADGSGMSYADKANVKNLATSGTFNLYAKWTLGKVILPSPTKTGYSFGGWYANSTLTTSAGVAGASYTPTSNVTLYAKWTANTYTVKFNGNGATSGSMSDQSFTYDVAQNLTANAFKRAYTVTYNYNGATGGNSASTATATATFNGWATSASGAKVYNDKQSVKNLAASGTYTLYANWTLSSVTLPTPTKTGYSFGGWYTDSALTASAGAAGASYTPTANVTLYAKWTNNTYTVKFNGNGATSGSMSDQTFTYDAAQNLTANALKRAYTVTYNYNGATGGNSASTATATATFNGWATSASGAKVYDDKQSVKNLVTSGTYNLYANWTLSSVTLPTPTRTGYTFGGWYTDSALTTSAGAAGANYTPSAATTLYAKWTEAILTKIAVKTNPTKTNYYVGDTLDVTGLTLTASYSDGSTKTISSGFICSPTALNTAGTQTITVTYSGKSTTFTVTVNPDAVKSIAVKTNPTKTSYYVGDTLDTAGLTLTATYNSGKTETVSSGFTCSPTALNTAGTQTITVTYSEKTATFTVTVIESVPTDAPRMTLSKPTAKAGDRVDVTLSIANNPGIIATSVNLTYDNTILKLVDVKDGGLLGTSSFSPGKDYSLIPYTVIWADGLATQNYTSNGVLATFTFEVLEGAPLGETPITLNYIKNSTINVDLDEAQFAITSGSITVTNRTPGDVNGDGIVDLKDVVILRRHLSGGWNVTIDEANADVNADQRTDLKDAVLITRFLSGGWNVTLV